MISSMIFFPEKEFYEKPADFGFDYEEVFLKTPDGILLHGWLLKSPQEKGVILFFHGNAGNISNRLYKTKGWIERGFSVFLIDYRGYGKSQGHITHERDVLVDAQTAFAWLAEIKKTPLDRLIFYGESLGTYPAIRMGAEKKAGGVILEAPFTSFYELAREHYPFLPAGMLKDFEFPNAQYIAQLQSPLFILHGTRDEICPYNMAGELFEKAPEPKGFLSIPNGAHNDLPMIAGEDFWDKPCEFISKYLL